MLPAPAAAQTVTVFAETFDSYQPALQGEQCDTGLLVYGSGTVAGWTGSGVNHTHAVDLDPSTDHDFALHLYTGGSTTAPNSLITDGSIDANTTGVTYSFAYAAAPTAWSHCYQGTAADDGLVIEILRADDSVLASQVHQTGAWTGGPNAQDLSPGAGFSWVGDGSGAVRIRISSLRSNTNTFAGAIDNIRITTDGGGKPPEPDLDTDDDGVPDVSDNCVFTPNPDQADTNGNGIGDACEATAGGCEEGGAGCCGGDFSSDTLATAWNLSALGDGTASLAEALGGDLLLTGTGSEMYHAADHGSFLHQTVEGDFRVEMDITGVPVDAGGQYRKGGLMVRTDLEPDAPRVMVQYIPHFPNVHAPGADYPALQFDVRDETGLGFELASTVPHIILPVRVAIQRRGDLFSVFYSADGGASWIQPLGGAGGEVEIPAPAEMLVGASVSSYDPSQAATFRFADAGICRPTGEPRDPRPYNCEEETPLDVVLLLDRSDSMARPHGGAGDGSDPSKLQSAVDALRELTSRLAGRTATTRIALVSFQGGSHPAVNLDSGAVVESSFTDPASIDALLQTFDLPVMDPYQPQTTTPMALAFEEALGLVLRDRIPGHHGAVVLASDSLPNIDVLGVGPGGYAEAE
ncbi:MAG: VWA domain-containing protein, partial [Holophagales bacterium]|nr:VWA domain-containing protein [Holophagales bacterium]